MTDLSDIYHNMKVTVTSPDGVISVTGDNQYNIQVSFRDEDAYEGYDVETLTYQLAVVLRRLESRRIEGLQKIRDSTPLRSDDSSKPHSEANRRRCRTELQALVAVGFSRSDIVDVAASNMLSDYEVFIDERDLSGLDLEDFLSEFQSAYFAMIRDFRTKQRELRRMHVPD